MDLRRERSKTYSLVVGADELIATGRGPKRARCLGADEQRGDGGASATAAVVDHGEVYDIDVGSRRIRVAPSTLVPVVANGGLRHRPAHRLAARDVVVCAEGYFPRSRSWGSRRARLVGAFLGDGWIRHEPGRRGYSLGLAIGTGAEPHVGRYLELVEEVLPNDGWGRGWRVDAPGHFGLSCSSKSAWMAAVALGLGERSKMKALPEEAFALVAEEKRALIAGYFDADGSVAGPGTSNHGRGTVATTSPLLAEGLRELAIACDMQVTTIGSAARQTNYGDSTMFRFVIAAGSMAQVPIWHAGKAANQRATSRATKGLSAQYLGGVVLPRGAFARRVRSIARGRGERCRLRIAGGGDVVVGGVALPTYDPYKD